MGNTSYFSGFLIGMTIPEATNFIKDNIVYGRNDTHRITTISHRI